MVLISKTKTLKDLEARLSIKSYGEWAKGYDEGLRDAIRVVKYQKHIGAEPVRHARWVKRGNKWQCTHCEVLMNIDGTPEENLLSFCPNCGARMEVKEND